MLTRARYFASKESISAVQPGSLTQTCQGMALSADDHAYSARGGQQDGAGETLHTLTSHLP